MGLSPFSASIDWFQGLGDVYFAVNFRLLPSFIVGSLFGAASAGKIATYAILLGELVLRRFSVQSLLESIEGRIDRGGARNMYHASAFLSPHAYLWAASADTSSWQPHCWRSASERGVPSIGRVLEV